MSGTSRRRLRIPDATATLIRHAHPNLKRRIRAALQAILDDPSAGKALDDDLSGLRSFRIGRMRMIYRSTSREIVEIVTIGPRKTVYKETFRLVSNSPHTSMIEPHS